MASSISPYNEPHIHEPYKGTYTVPTYTVPAQNLTTTLITRGVGFGNQFKFFEEILSGSSISKYPPYDIISMGKDKYEIRFALAGFTKKGIDVTVQNNVLKVTGEGIDSTFSEGELDYIHHGIAKRDFTQTFPLADYLEVVSAEMADGILTIKLERNLPEELQPKSIKIK